MNDFKHDDALRSELEAHIRAFCAGPLNDMQRETPEPAWDAPLIGYARGDDALFSLFKDVVAPFHWTPQEVFALAFPDRPVEPAALTVIAWILPQTRQTKTDNRRQRKYPAERWARTRVYGELFNRQLRQAVADWLAVHGIEAVAPMLLADWSERMSPHFGDASTWSERHAAYACGLGTFGLSDGLITPLGKAMRVGSVVARMALEPTPRPYTGRSDYCLYRTHGTCGWCINRCPAGAISHAGHDKRKCREYLQLTAKYVKSVYGFDGYGCGLCQTGVPCESGIPKGVRLARLDDQPR